MNLNKLSNDLLSHIDDVTKNDFLQSLENFLSKDGKEIEMIETATIDRIESDFAVCELSDKSFVNVPLDKFDFEINASDIVKLNLQYENGKISDISVISKDDDEKQVRQNIINEKFNKLKNS